MIDKEKEKVDELMTEDFRSVLDLTERLNLQKKVDTDRNWQQLHRRIHTDKKQHLLFPWVRNIAAAMLLPFLGIALYYYLQTERLKSLSGAELETVTAYGVRTRLTLSDGSEVWLNSGSTLAYPKHFTGGERTVELKGEAYFKVQSDREHRFDVKTLDGITVSAYGTEFNVDAYADAPVIKATLAKGHIQAGQGRQTIDLAPSEQLVYNRNSRKAEIKKVNLQVETAWKDGKLVFRRTPMDVIAKKLSRHFNVDVVLQDDELFSYTYSATFTTETLAEILELFEATAPISCVIIEPEKHDEFTFTRKKVIISRKQG